MLSSFTHHSAGRALAAFVLGGTILLGGCHSQSADLAKPFALVSDTPSSYPAVPALFQVTSLPTSPTSPKIENTPLPPAPSDPSQVAQGALKVIPKPVEPTDAGLVVCDPICATVGLSDFGVGCGWWLDLMAAGQPELGQTPLWEASSRVLQETGRTALDMTPSQAEAYATITGATHALCGTLTGTPTACTLTYTLCDLRHPGKTVGPPLVQTGTEAQVLAALPGMARTLDARLGVPHPQIPTSVGVSPVELTQIVTISTANTPSDSDLLTLFNLTAHTPLAGITFLESSAVDDQALLTHTVKTLMTQIPDNALMLSMVGYGHPAALRPYAAWTQQISHKYPASALLAHTQVWEQREWGTRAGEYAAALRATQDAPRDPMTWLSLGTTFENLSGDLRQGRFAGELSSADWSALGRLYGQQETDDYIATRLDPRNGHAWCDLASAATAAGDTARSDAAMQRALALDPNKAEVYEWALQMYQAKWNDEPIALGNVATLAVAHPWDDSSDAVGISDNLNSAGLNPQAAQVLAAMVARERALVAKSPSDLFAHWNLAQALAAQNTGASQREATWEYRIAEHLMPRSSALHADLADLLDQRSLTKEAIAEYRQAIALTPYNATYRASLGHDLKHVHQFAQALPELHAAALLNPRDADTYATMGDLLSMQHQYAAAVPEYRTALRLDYFNLEALTGMPGPLDSDGQYGASLQAAQHAIQILSEMRQGGGEDEAPLRDVMADDYLHQKKWTQSITQSQQALLCYAGDACAHENLAEAYIGQGKKDQADTEWHTAIAMHDPIITPIAEKLMAAHGLQ